MLLGLAIRLISVPSLVEPLTAQAGCCSSIQTASVSMLVKWQLLRALVADLPFTSAATNLRMLHGCLLILRAGYPELWISSARVEGPGKGKTSWGAGLDASISICGALCPGKVPCDCSALDSGVGLGLASVCLPCVVRQKRIYDADAEASKGFQVLYGPWASLLGHVWCPGGRRAEAELEASGRAAACGALWPRTLEGNDSCAFKRRAAHSALGRRARKVKYIASGGGSLKVPNSDAYPYGCS